MRTPADPPIAELQQELDRHADEKKRAWWTRYLKGEAQFRGVATADIRTATGAWWGGHHGAELEPSEQLATCLDLIACPMTEDKIAGMLLLGEHLVPAGRVDCADATPRFGELFARGHLGDWNVVDWFCVRVLGPLIDRSGEDCARSVAAWVEAQTLWQRRAALVGFVTLAPKGQYADLIIGTADALVLDSSRFAQTGVAWVVRELSASHPEMAAAFLARHQEHMSPEARKQAVGRRR